MGLHVGGKSTANLTHGPFRADKSGPVDQMALFFGPHRRTEGVGNVLITPAAAQHGSDIHFMQGEEAGPELAIRRDPDAVTAVTEGLAHRADETELARAICKAVSFCRPSIVFLPGHQRKLFFNAADDFARGDDLFARPSVVLADRHELNKPDDER